MATLKIKFAFVNKREKEKNVFGRFCFCIDDIFRIPEQLLESKAAIGKPEQAP